MKLALFAGSSPAFCRILCDKSLGGACAFCRILCDKKLGGGGGGGGGSLGPRLSPLKTGGRREPGNIRVKSCQLLARHQPCDKRRTLLLLW